MMLALRFYLQRSFTFLNQISTPTLLHFQTPSHDFLFKFESLSRFSFTDVKVHIFKARHATSVVLFLCCNLDLRINNWGIK